jgi:predicted aspartyl protease
MILKRLIGAAALAVAAFAWPGLSAANCTLNVVSEFHVTMLGNEPLVDATINGQPVRFKVDLGFTNTIISRAGAERLGLKPHRVDNMTYYGVGGSEVPGEAIVNELKIGNEVAHKIDLIVVGRGLNSANYIGLMGQDLLSQADIELDFAHSSMRIIKPKGCEGDQVVYSWKSYSLASLIPSNRSEIVKVDVLLNGHSATAQIDTGAYTSVVSTAMAERAGVTPKTEDLQPAGTSVGIAGKPVQTTLAIFPTFSVGDESINNAKLRIADIWHGDAQTHIDSRIAKTFDGMPDMLLGADFIRAHHIYIARSQGKMYFAYNGGPIFQVVRPAPEGDASGAQER